MYETSCQSRFDAGYWMLGAGALGGPSQQAGLQVGFQEGAPWSPPTPGQGPAVSPGAVWERCGERGREGRRASGPGCGPAWSPRTQGRPELTTCLLAPSVCPFQSHAISAGAPGLGACLCNTSVLFSSVAQSCPTLCNSMNRSTPGLPVHHQLPEFTQTHVGD